MNHAHGKGGRPRQLAEGEPEGATVTSQELKGFLGIWTDIDTEFIPTFRDWHSTEHMALRINTPGWYVGHRYAGLDGAPGFLIAYETAAVADLAGTAYHQSMNEPDQRTREALGHYRNAMRTIYGLRTQAGEVLPTDAPYYLAVRFTTGAGSDRVVEWCGATHLPAVCSIPGVRRARLYEIDAATSQIMTAERQLYRAGPGTERFLATYELASRDILDSPAWRTAMLGSTTAGGSLPEIQIRHQDLFVLEFTIYPVQLRKGAVVRPL
jgi:hypothetical protein